MIVYTYTNFCSIPPLGALASCSRLCVALSAQLVVGRLCLSTFANSKKNETGCYTQNPGLWDCSPFLHKHTNVEQLDSGIVVHPYTGIHMCSNWTLGLRSIAQT